MKSTTFYSLIFLWSYNHRYYYLLLLPFLLEDLILGSGGFTLFTIGLYLHRYTHIRPQPSTGRVRSGLCERALKAITAGVYSRALINNLNKLTDEIYSLAVSVSQLRFIYHLLLVAAKEYRAMDLNQCMCTV